MGILNSIISDLDAAAFTDPDLFGEEVTYTPRGGEPRTINADVQRDPPVEIDLPGGQARRPKMIVTIRNHATLGADAIDSGGDTITVAYRLGGTAQAHAVGAPLASDEGCWKLPVG